MNILFKILSFPFLSLKQSYFLTKNAFLQLKGVKNLVSNNVELFHENVSYKEGRELYLKIHGEKDFLNENYINNQINIARITAIILLCYTMYAIYKLDLFSIIFAITVYFIFLIFSLQYSLWMNKNKCIIPVKKFLIHLTKEKDCFIWFINNKYRSGNGF